MSCLPLELTNHLADRYPGCWDIIDDIVQNKGQNGIPEWDNRCYIPVAATISITSTLGSQGVTVESVNDASAMAAVAPWRQYKQIFTFAPEMEELLAGQAEDCDLPMDVLFNLPYPSIYIQLHDSELDGFFVHFESDVQDGRTELRLLCLYKNMDYSAVIIHLHEGGTISSGLQDAAAEAQRVYKSIGHTAEDEMYNSVVKGNTDMIFGLTAPMVQLVLYICSQNAEITPNPTQEKIFRQPKDKSLIRDKYREVRRFDCGEDTARAIRVYGKHGTQDTVVKGGTGAEKRPHVRKGHWHHYWTGSKENRKLILKWNAPTFIHREKVEESVPTENMIKKPKE